MAPTPVSAAANASPEVEAVVKRITDQGDKIRKLKGEKAAKVRAFHMHKFDWHKSD